MNDEPALLAAIRAHPEEDTPRLAYADWLDEQSQHARAEFIRVGCDAAKWGCTFAQTNEQQGWSHKCGTDDAGYWRCTNPRLREQELWDSHARDWFPLLDTFKMGRHRRGFVESLDCTADDWLANGDAIRALHPVTRVRLTTRPKVEWSDGRTEIFYRAPKLFTRLPGRKPVRVDWGLPFNRRVQFVLERTWEGVTFELPP